MAATSSNPALDALLADLTAPQAEAVRHTDGPLLVLAGAGCGKTRVITRRAAYLARTVTTPDRVLAITFTNKAANEMRERLEMLGIGRRMTVCTFHALCARLLREYHADVGLPADFTIFDTADQRRVVKDAIESRGLSTDQWAPAKIQTVISRAKNDMLTAEAFARLAGDWSQRGVARIYAEYERLLAAQHGLDFDDLLLKLALHLDKDEDLCRRLEQRYTHVLIDEYQDTNAAQYTIAHRITGKNHNLCATGDPDQSIYGWRGADIGNILRFEEDHPDAHVVRLEQNYRSTKKILAAAGAVIARNVRRKKKGLWTENPAGDDVRVLEFDNAEQEGEYIAKEIARYADQGGAYGDVAIFYRTNALSRIVEEALLRRGIPYQIARGTEFYNRKEIKDLLAYVRVLVNPHDEVSLTRIINTPARGIGETTVGRLLDAARRTGRRLIDVLNDPDAVKALKGAAAGRVERFVQLLNELMPLADEPPKFALEALYRKSGLQAELAGIRTHDAEPAQNVGELISAAAAFALENPHAHLRDWLEHISLLSDVDAVDPARGAVTLMTLHAAKGLEFPVVYIIALEDGLVPFCRNGEEEDTEEERRLLFVGMTRAMRQLNLAHAAERASYGAFERRIRSPFLEALPEEGVQHVDAGAESSDSRRKRGPALPADIVEWERGTLVRHPEYGLGRILQIYRNGLQVNVKVQFESGEVQPFILPFADLVRVPFDEVD
jgi:DNA helicase-2/ATP-dependent DNA helicase PcrA